MEEIARKIARDIDGIKPARFAEVCRRVATMMATTYEQSQHQFGTHGDLAEDWGYLEVQLFELVRQMEAETAIDSK